jgi:hypothetical protein
MVYAYPIKPCARLFQIVEFIVPVSTVGTPVNNQVVITIRTAEHDKKLWLPR